MRHNKLYFALVGLLAGCGGGGGSDSKPSIETGVCGNTQEHSCSYSVDQLQANFRVEVDNSADQVELHATVSRIGDHINELILADEDRFEIVADGKTYRSRVNEFGKIEFDKVSMSSNHDYEFFYYRNDQLAGYATLLYGPDKVEQGGTASAIVGGNEFSFDALMGAHTSFDILDLSLSCTVFEPFQDKDWYVDNSDRKRPDLKDVYGSQTWQLDTIFGISYSDLQATYDTCSVRAYYWGDTQTTSAEVHDGTVYVSTLSAQMLERKVF